jgi:hypothetical protein
MGISDLAIIRCVFHINAAKKKSRFITLILVSGKIIDAVASLNPPVSADFRGDTPTRFCTEEVVTSAARCGQEGALKTIEEHSRFRFLKMNGRSPVLSQQRLARKTQSRNSQQKGSTLILKILGMSHHFGLLRYTVYSSVACD